jgi:hypothetical protein
VLNHSIYSTIFQKTSATPQTRRIVEAEPCMRLSLLSSDGKNSRQEICSSHDTHGSWSQASAMVSRSVPTYSQDGSQARKMVGPKQSQKHVSEQELDLDEIKSFKA